MIVTVTKNSDWIEFIGRSGKIINKIQDSYLVDFGVKQIAHYTLHNGGSRPGTFWWLKKDELNFKQAVAKQFL